MSSIAVVGAGNIGCYIGGRLAAGGASVDFIGRDRVRQELARHGLRLSDYLGDHQTVAAEQLRFSTTMQAAAAADLVLVTVKSGATQQVGRELASVLRPGALVISWQNGLHNAEWLQAELPRHKVLRGMVPFNVVADGQGGFHQATEGTLEVEADPEVEAWRPVFQQAGLTLHSHADMRSVMWAKMLMNLNNAINALSGLPVQAELSQRAFRQCLSLAQIEALAVLAHTGIQPARLTPLPAAWVARLLCVPDGLFRLLANKMLAIDPTARSSMLVDLQMGRTTEVDWLNGEVVRLAQQQSSRAPVNARLVELVKAAEQGGRRDWSGPELLATLIQARASGT